MTTHAELCVIARDWLVKRAGCYFAVSELMTYAGEIPDAIGFKSAISVLIECKTSRSDFLADAHKWHRCDALRGMGDHRYFLSAPDIIKNYEEVPVGWGLLHWDGKKVKIIRSPVLIERTEWMSQKKRKVIDLNHNRMEKSHYKEAAFLTSVITRMANDCPYIRGKISVKAGWQNFDRKKKP